MRAAHGSIRGVLFDKDGTLIDFHRSWSPVIHNVVRGLTGGDAALTAALFAAGGFDPTTNRTAPATPLAVGTTVEIAEVWAPLLGETDFDGLVVRIDEAFRRDGPRCAVPIEGLEATLSHLATRGCALGVATSDSEAATHEVLRHLGLHARFAFVCGYDTGHGIKPGPGMVLGFCAATGLPPAQIAVVGDNVHDLEMAHAAGAGLIIGVLSGTGDAETLGRLADVVLASVAELPRLPAFAGG
ncbi:MAG: HAD family hydrolase [Myxococcales bacterium]|nr:HAD family hydrolase [Myxococcales bacterium]